MTKEILKPMKLYVYQSLQYIFKKGRQVMSKKV